MITVCLSNEPHNDGTRLLSPTQVMPDCDCACPIDGLNIPTLDMPKYYSLELTPSCNNRCPGCSNVFFEDVPNRIQIAPARSPLPFNKWQEILDTISPYATRLKITGGEATLHPHFEQIITSIESRGITFTLFTNARWQEPQRTIDFLRTQETCAGLLISLHGATEEAHEQFTGIPGSFAETVRNIALATEAGLSVHTSCVFTSQNLNQISDIITLSNKLGAKATVFNRYIGQPVDALKVSAAQLAHAVKEVDKHVAAGQSVHFGTCIPLCFVESTSTGCLAGTAYCTIDPWGNMRPCNHTPWLTGNILTDSLEESWNSFQMNQFRDLLPNSGCTDCSLFSTCRGGCRADAILNGAHKDPLMTSAITIPLHTIETQYTQISLYRYAKMRLTSEILAQNFGYLLNRGDRMLPVPKQFDHVLDKFDTEMHLQNIYDSYGQHTLNFIGDLYEQGFITLDW